MKPAPFDTPPETVDDVVALLAEHGDDAKVLAGGQSLVPMLALRLTRFEHLVDLNRVGELARHRTRATARSVVRAVTRQRVMERDAEIAAAVPLLARATPLIGHFQIRNRGTVGGSLAHADPASEYPAVAVALGAELELAGAGGTAGACPADDFFVGHLDDRRSSPTSSSSPRTSRCGRAAAASRSRRSPAATATSRSPASACAVDDDAAGRGDRAVRRGLDAGARARAAEAALLGRRRAAADVAEIALAAAELDPPADVHASAAYRAAHRRAISSNARVDPRPGGIACCRLR